MGSIEESGELLADPLDRVIDDEGSNAPLLLPIPHQRREPLEMARFPDATTLYLHRDIQYTRLLKAWEEVELAKRIEAGLFAAKALEHEGLLERIIEDNFEQWEMAGAMPDEIPEEERTQFEADLRRDLPTIAEEGEAAKVLYIESNVRLVVSIANAKYRMHKGLPFIDLIQIGNLGLMRAVEMFDYTKGYKFSTYAAWWIRQTINREYAKQVWIARLPNNQIEQANKIMKASDELTRMSGKEPSVAELAKASGVAEAHVRKILPWLKQPLYLDTPLSDGSSMSLGDVVPYREPGYDEAENRALKEAVHKALDQLTDREAAIIRLRYGFEGHAHTREQIAQIFEVTRERIRQIEVRALGKLRRYGGYLMAYR